MKIYIRAAVKPLTDEDYMAQTDIASDPNTSSEDLDLLADTINSIHSFVFSAICNNPNTSLETLLKLDKKFPNSEYVEEAIASHPDTPQSMLLDLAKHSNDYCMPSILAKNPNIPIEALLELYNKNPKNIDIKRALSTRFDVPTEIISDILNRSHGYDYDDDILLNIMTHNNLTEEQFDRLGFLAYICSLSIHKTALLYATSDKASPKYLSDLASLTRYQDIRQAVYENPNTPESTKAWLHKYLEKQKK